MFRTPPGEIETLPVEYQEPDTEEITDELEEAEQFAKKRQRLKSQTYLTNMANNVTGSGDYLIL